MIRGKIHEYIGMTLYYNIRGQVRITITIYTKDILSAFDKSDPKGDGKK